MRPHETPHGQVAFQFANALAEGEFESAHHLLATSLQQTLDVPQLAAKYDEMVDLYEDGFRPADHVEVMEVMDDWPAKQDDDLGWAYVSISGAFARGGWCEGVAVVVINCPDGHRIREIEWGRP